MLPELLSLSDPAIRRRLLPVLGERGRWLSRFREDWHWAGARDTIAVAARLDPARPEASLEEGTSGERQEALRRLRHADPTLARQWLADGIEGEKAETRAAILETMTVELSADDEVFLESRLDDRSENVRRAPRGSWRVCPALNWPGGCGSVRSRCSRSRLRACFRRRTS